MIVIKEACCPAFLFQFHNKDFQIEFNLIRGDQKIQETWILIAHTDQSRGQKETYS